MIPSREPAVSRQAGALHPDSASEALKRSAAERARIKAAVGKIESALKKWQGEKKRFKAVHGTRINAAEAELQQREAAWRAAAAQEGQHRAGLAELQSRVARQQQVVVAEHRHYAESLQSVEGVLNDLRRQLQLRQQELAAFDQRYRRILAEDVAPMGPGSPEPQIAPLSDAGQVEVANVPVSFPQMGRGEARRLFPRGALAAGIAALLAVSLGAIGWVFDFRLLPRGEMAVRVVADQDSEAIANASVVLFFEGGPVAQYSDIRGSSTLLLDRSRGRRGRLVVEKAGFRIHEQEVRLREDGPVEVRLEPPAPQHSDILVRAVDSVTGEPVAQAEVLILVGSDRFSQLTDDHGLGRFALGFLDDKLDVEMGVSSRDHEYEHNRVTLLPNRVQDISLDRTTARLRVNELDLDRALMANFREAEGNRLLPGSSAMGTSGQGTVNRYTFAGHRNSPLVFQFQSTAGELRFGVAIEGPQGTLVAEHGPYVACPCTLPFTPQQEGEHEIRVQGLGRGSSYKIALSSVGESLPGRKAAVSLGLGHRAKGMLAAGSWNDFTFEGTARTPLLFKLQRSMGELGYTLSFYDDQGNQLARHGRFLGGHQSVPFIPPKTGAYRARLQGTEAHGGYSMTLSQPAPAVVVPLVLTAAPMEAPQGHPVAPEKDDSLGWVNVLRSVEPPGQAPAPGFRRRHP